MREHPVGVWKYMPPQEDLDWSKKPHNRGFGRFDATALWRVSTRKEMNEYHDLVMKQTYKKLIVCVISLIATFYSFSMYVQTKDLAFAFFSIVFVALVSRYYTSAWGGYAGGWSDYEHDPVQVLPHNSYVLTGNKLM